jgi:hypothetical protein
MSRPPRRRLKLFAQQLRQLGNIDGDPLRLVARSQVFDF